MHITLDEQGQVKNTPQVSPQILFSHIFIFGLIPPCMDRLNNVEAELHVREDGTFPN